jgi:hypothetical protein
MSTPAFSKNNSTIRRGQLLSCIIDMGTNRITDLGNPIGVQDATPRYYVDQAVANGTPTVTITLSGTTWNMFILNQTGTFDILVTNIVSGGANAKFTIMKPDASRNASIQRWGSNAGTTTLERLEMQWLPNSGVEIRKNGSGHDGQYKIRYFSV